MWLSPEINFSAMTGFLVLLRKMSEGIVSLTDYLRYTNKPAYGARLICISLPMMPTCQR
jgi:hypothetical protein